MPDIGWTELLLIAALAIIVVGPKDLPRLMREAGRWLNAARRAAREFQDGFEELAREAEIADLDAKVKGQGLKPKPANAPPAIAEGPVTPSLPSPLGEAGAVFVPPDEGDREDDPAAARDEPGPHPQGPRP